MAEGTDEPKKGKSKKGPLAVIDEMMKTYHDQKGQIIPDNRALIQDFVDKHSLIERADDSVDTAGPPDVGADGDEVEGETAVEDPPENMFLETTLEVSSGNEDDNKNLESSEQESMPVGGKYGTDRDMTLEDVKTIVKAYEAYQVRGGKLPEFYRRSTSYSDKFKLETLRKWVKDPKFKP